MYIFEKLTVWQRARSLVKEVYLLTALFPEEEKFGLRSQIQRAVVSVSSNIAEGSGRYFNKEKLHFYSIAYGSLLEVVSQLFLACDLGYIQSSDLERLEPAMDEIARMINGMMKTIRQKE